MWMQITYIIKEDFFDASVKAFHTSITANNIRAGFRATGLVPFDPESVVSRLDPKPITPSPLNSHPGTATSWVPKTPSNAYEAGQSSSTLKRKIENHRGSSPTHIFDIIDLQAKSISKLAHEIVLLCAENKELYTANERQSKRYRTKRTHLQEGGSLSLQEAMVLMAEKGLGDQDYEETSRGSDCIIVACEMSEESDSDNKTLSKGATRYVGPLAMQVRYPIGDEGSFADIESEIYSANTAQTTIQQTPFATPTVYLTVRSGNTPLQTTTIQHLTDLLMPLRIHQPTVFMSAIITTCFPAYIRSIIERRG
ncbi:hypothetical protein V491_03071 [Pseudogymnoascus sp. VKM F-3775]|nr:hypothetical protein V491_03071 [Pseudogymnoascus sp. VKM F-3775]